jgi:hypothetical protein
VGGFNYSPAFDFDSDAFHDPTVTANADKSGQRQLDVTDKFSHVVIERTIIIISLPKFFAIHC